MLKEVIMPQLGATMTSGTVVEWLKKEGDWVEKGEPLVEILTDKVNIEVESLDSGFLKKIVAQEGEELPVTHVIAYIGDKDDEVPPELLAGTAEPAGVQTPKPVAEPQGGAAPAQAEERGQAGTKASPLARKLAREGGVDLESIRGSGPNGRITKADVLKAIEEREKGAPPAEAARVAAPPVPGAPRVARVVPLAGVRRTIAERMAESFRDAPHIVTTMSADMTQARGVRDSLLPLIEEQAGVRLSYTDFVVKATALALKEYPAFNSSLVDGKISVYQDVNVGLAVDVPTGLIVPTMFGVDRLSLPEIARVRGELVKKALDGSLSLQEVSGGTFTVSNLGMYGVESFVAVINPPQAAILAIGAIEERAVVREGQIVIQPRVTLSLSSDHRVVDGAQSARFLGCVRDLLENPSRMLVSD